METVDAQYGTAAQSLLAQLEQDPSNPHGPSQRGKRLLRPGAWRRSTTRPTTMAVRTRRSSSSRPSATTTSIWPDNAGAKSALVDRAICVFYTGDHASAIAALEDLTQNVDPGFAPAWANLGMFYENDGRTDDARQAYETAIEAAGDADAYGVRDYAQDRLDALNGTS